MEKKIIGRKEKISLPDLGLKLVWAKVDTGAYTSSVHAENIRLENREGKEVVVENFREKKVKNSFGHAETRFLIITKMILAGETFDAEVTLTDRSSMKNAILLGRKTLRNRFLVDVSGMNLAKAYRKK